MAAQPALAKPAAKAPPVLPKAEADALIGGVVFARPKSWLERLRRGIAWAIKTVSRDEFMAACTTAIAFVDGKAVEQEEAARIVQRMVQAATGGQAHALCLKCDVSDQAVMAIFLGEPQAGFWFTRALKLKDPKGARRG